MSLLLTTGIVFAGTSRNLLPRIPEFIIEKGYSDSFEVTDCKVKVKISGSTAESTLEVLIKNISDNVVKSSIKFRILYPTSKSMVRLKVNGKSANYNRENPRHSFKLASQESLRLELKAKTSINYSVDSVREALREEAAQAKKRFALQDFSKLFAREKFGKRFMIGPLVSKWGIFPISFKNVSIKVTIPRHFSLFSNNMEKWTENKKANGITYSYTQTDGFSGSVFLPETDVKEFSQRQKVLTSKEFMH